MGNAFELKKTESDAKKNLHKFNNFIKKTNFRLQPQEHAGLDAETMLSRREKKRVREYTLSI